MNNPYIDNRKCLDVLRSCQTFPQFQTAQKMVLTHTDALDALIQGLEMKGVRKRDDDAYIAQLNHLRDTTLRELRERGVHFGEGEL